MIPDLYERLAHAAEQRSRLERLRRQVAELESEHREAAESAVRLKQRLAKEEHDVQQLEGLSLSGLLASLFGSKEERLLKERQEAVAAQLQYDEARVRHERLAAELDRVRRELAALAGAEANYQTLLTEKERAMRLKNDGSAAELLRLSEAEQQLSWQLKELAEARNAGHEAGAALARVAASLQSARNWGTWDMLGGGWIATAGKHARIDEAREELYEAQERLARFRRELKDIQASFSLPDVRLDAFTRFADFFFDGLLMDIAVQSEINRSHQAIERARGQVGDLLRWLDQRMAEVEEQAAGISRQKQRFVEGYTDR